MANPFSNIEETFKNAFEHWEAPHSPAEMNAGWNRVANHLPHIPGGHAPSAGHVAGHVAGSVGKIIGFTGLGAAVITSAAVLYNIYVKPVKPTPGESVKPSSKTEQVKPEAKPTVDQGQKNTVLAYPSVSNGKVRKNSNEFVSGQPQNDYSKISAANPFSPAPVQGIEDPQKQNTVPENINKPVAPKTQTATNQVQYMKLFLSDTVVCVGVPVSASSNVSYPGVVIEWGDGKWNQFSGENVHTYSRAGVFRAHLTIDSIRADRIITVLATPKARFTVNQAGKLECSFNNTSVNANNYDWNYGDGSADEQGFYPSHAYDDTGRYEVRLVAIGSSGCADTSVQYINVQKFTEPGITSNAITPNGDGLNDDVGVNIEGETSFQFTIADATGQVVFQTSDKSRAWGGQNQFTGSECKAGIYYYTIKYSFKGNPAPKPKQGSINLIRSKN